jgi:hypothetical protein
MDGARQASRQKGGSKLPHSNDLLPPTPRRLAGDVLVSRIPPITLARTGGNSGCTEVQKTARDKIVTGIVFNRLIRDPKAPI